MLILKRPTAIRNYVSVWQQQRPDFLWVPDSSANLLLDQARGLVGKVAGTKALAHGGLVNPADGSGTDWVEFATNVGVTANDIPFIGFALVSLAPQGTAQGCFLKIGSDANGLGFGFGNTTFENAGTKTVLLREGLAWYVGTAGEIASGLNVMSFGTGTNAGAALITVCNNSTIADEAGVAATSTQAIDARLRINGYYTSRGTGAIVHAVAIFKRSLDVVDGRYQAFRSRMTAPFAPLARTPFPHARQMFVPRRSPIPTAAAASSLPTLSAITASNITSSGARLTVTA